MASLIVSYIVRLSCETLKQCASNVFIVDSSCNLEKEYSDVTLMWGYTCVSFREM